MYPGYPTSGTSVEPASGWSARVALPQTFNTYHKASLLLVVRFVAVLSQSSKFMFCLYSYSSETWTTFSRHIKKLERFHQTCLSRILNIGWQSFTADTTALQPANVSSVGKCTSYEPKCVGLDILLGWKMTDARSKQLFYGELQCGKRPRHKT